MLNIYEVFDLFKAAPDRQNKIEVLRRNSTYALQAVLTGMFHPNVQFAITETPNYKPVPVPPGMSYNHMHDAVKRAYLYTSNDPRVPAGLTPERRRILLIQTLESMEPREAEVYMMMLLKTPPEGLDEALVKEAFPTLLT